MRICSARHLRAFVGDQAGATAIEYALILTGVGLALLASMPQMHSKLGGLYQNLLNNMDTVM